MTDCKDIFKSWESLPPPPPTVDLSTWILGAKDTFQCADDWKVRMLFAPELLLNPTHVL